MMLGPVAIPYDIEQTWFGFGLRGFGLNPNGDF
jgi:hypothetical protein